MKTIAYIRVSTNLQDVESQRFGILNYCKQNRIIIDKWVEDVISGRSDFSDRNFGEVYEQLEEGDLLIVTELSRLSRDFFGTIRMIENLMKKKVSLLSIKENFTLKDDFPSKMMTAMYGMFAQIERDRISQRVKEGMARKKHEGKKMGRPGGKKSNPTKRLLFPHKSEIVSMVNKNVKMEAIAIEFNTNRVTLGRFIRDNNIRRQI